MYQGGAGDSAMRVRSATPKHDVLQHKRLHTQVQKNASATQQRLKAAVTMVTPWQQTEMMKGPTIRSQGLRNDTHAHNEEPMQTSDLIDPLDVQ